MKKTIIAGLVCAGALALSSSITANSVQAATNNGDGTVTVEAGDTYSKVAQEYNLSVASLEQMNGRKVGGYDLIFVGDKIKVQASAVETSRPAQQQQAQQPVQQQAKTVTYQAPAQPQVQQNNYSGTKLTASAGVVYGPSGKETYYNLNMSGVVANAQAAGISGTYGVRADGVKTYNGLVIVAANTNVHAKGSIIQTSLGTGIVLDHCVASESTGQLDIATTW